MSKCAANALSARQRPSVSRSSWEHHQSRRQPVRMARNDVMRTSALRAPLPSECRRTQFFKKLSFYLRFVGNAHKSDDNTLHPRGTIPCRARAIQNFTNTFAHWIEIWFLVVGYHQRFSSSFQRQRPALQSIRAFSNRFDSPLECRHHARSTVCMSGGTGTVARVGAGRCVTRLEKYTPTDNEALHPQVAGNSDAPILRVLACPRNQGRHPAAVAYSAIRRRYYENLP